MRRQSMTRPHLTAGVFEQSDLHQNWFVMLNSVEFGPYSLSDLIGLRQEKKMRASDLVWHESLVNWTPMEQVETLSMAHIKTYKQAHKSAFINRKHTRLEGQWQVFVSNDLVLWTGDLRSLSAGGCLIGLPDSSLASGQFVRIHFPVHHPCPTHFQGVGEILEKRLVPRDWWHTPHGEKTFYAISFVKLSLNAADRIELMAQEAEKQREVQHASA